MITPVFNGSLTLLPVIRIFHFIARSTLQRWWWGAQVAFQQFMHASYFARLDYLIDEPGIQLGNNLMNNSCIQWSLRIWNVLLTLIILRSHLNLNQSWLSWPFDLDWWDISFLIHFDVHSVHVTQYLNNKKKRKARSWLLSAHMVMIVIIGRNSGAGRNVRIGLI